MDLRMQSPLGAQTTFNGRVCDYFSGCSYLGLNNHPEVFRAAEQALAEYGLSTGTSRGGYGEHPLYDRLESAVNAMFGAEKMLYFPSGYLGMTLLLQGLAGRYERIFIDAEAHFSEWDGARTTGREVAVFNHRDPAHLRELLRNCLKPGERPVIVSDGVFPISGELPPLHEYVQLAEDWDGIVCLDDAHGGGAIGAHGRGCADHFGKESPRCFSGYTLSKAFGGFGGVIAGSQSMIDELESHSRVYVAASPIPLPVTAASAAAVEIARRQPELRQKLWENVAFVRQGFRQLGWPVDDSPVPIVCLRRMPGMDLGKIKDALFKRDICVAHVTTYSSTPVGGALRVAVFASHTRAQLERLLEETRKIIA